MGSLGRGFRCERGKTVAATHAQILIVGVPGRIQESLCTLLKAMPELDVLEGEMERRRVVDLKDGSPDLVLLEFCPTPEEFARELAWIRARWPGASCLVLADTARQIRLARTAGADGALLRGFAADEFFATLRDLLKGKVGLSLEAALTGTQAADSQPGISRGFGEAPVLIASPAVF